MIHRQAPLGQRSGDGVDHRLLPDDESDGVLQPLGRQVALHPTGSAGPPGRALAQRDVHVDAFGKPVAVLGLEREVFEAANAEQQHDCSEPFALAANALEDAPHRRLSRAARHQPQRLAEGALEREAVTGGLGDLGGGAFVQGGDGVGEGRAVFDEELERPQGAFGRGEGEGAVGGADLEVQVLAGSGERLAHGNRRLDEEANGSTRSAARLNARVEPVHSGVQVIVKPCVPFCGLRRSMTALAIVLTQSSTCGWAAGLPVLDSEFDLERLLKLSIESERKSIQLGQYEKSKERIEFERPDFAKLPKNLVAFYITERGCPSYFQTPREESAAFGKRVLLSLIGVFPDGDGWCENVFASSLARRIGTKGTLENAVATFKIHRFLKKDQLVAYDLHTVHLETGVIGVEDSAKTLFKKTLPELTLSELAELTLAMPPFGYWDQMRSCQNPILIKQNRDVVIDDLRRVSLVPEDLARSAMRQPVACTRDQ